jgi:predicted permease
LRATLVVSQAALSALLLCGAALFVRSLTNVRQLDLGFKADRLITATVTYDTRSRNDDPTFPTRLAELSRRIATIPGVSHVALAGSRPLYSISWLTFYTETDSMHSDFRPTFTAVSPGYFAASGIRLIDGADFTESPSGQHGAIVSETMARKAWPGRPALGQCMHFGKRDAACYRVIGVVADSREREIIEDAAPKYFLSLGDLPSEAKGWSANYVTVSADPARVAAITASMRSLIREQFPGGIPSIVRLSDYLEPKYRPWRLGATLFSAFGILALVVAVVGIYSTMSYGVQQRMHEFGVRVALGARVADVMRLVVGEGMRIVAIGVVIGIGLAVAAGRFVAALLYGVQPNDPATAVVVALCLLLAGSAAALVPAWRAAGVDPAATLKSD